MKVFTIATHESGYLSLLRKTSETWGYDLKILGWNQDWKGLGWKLELFLEALKALDPDEPVVCSDGYDVVVVGPAEELLHKFLHMGQPMVFSGQRYFPRNKWIQKLADEVMSDSQQQVVGSDSEGLYDYSRPCTGLFIGYAGALAGLFEELVETERQQSIGNDQILLNVYHLNHPGAIAVDNTCTLFQSLWRSRGGLFGSISSLDKRCEVEIVKGRTTPFPRVRNKKYRTTACLIHGPFNLDMTLLLEELALKPPKPEASKGWNYWNYSLWYYTKRGAVFYSRKALGLS